MRQFFAPHRLIAFALVLLALAQGLIAAYELWPWSAGLERALWFVVGANIILVLFAMAVLLTFVAWLRRGRLDQRRWFAFTVWLIVVLPVLNVLYLFWLPTPERLVHAASQGDVAVVERCLTWGIDPDSTYVQVLGFGGRGTSQTALQSAVAAGHMTVVKQLLDAGADPNLEDSYGQSACDLAERHSEVRSIIARLCDQQ